MRRHFGRRKRPIDRGPRVNNQIRISSVRVVDANGEDLGEMPTADALRLARERGLDLVEVGPRATPPVCRIVDYGKFKYEQAKRARTERRERNVVKSELKGVRITFRASPHDLAMRARQADAFLSDGHVVRIEMTLRGREKGKGDFAKGRMETFLQMLTVPWREQQGVRRGGRGLEMTIVRDKTKSRPTREPAETTLTNERRTDTNGTNASRRNRFVHSPEAYAETENQ